MARSARPEIVLLPRHIANLHHVVRKFDRAAAIRQPSNFAGRHCRRGHNTNLLHYEQLYRSNVASRQPSKYVRSSEPSPKAKEPVPRSEEGRVANHVSIHFEASLQLLIKKSPGFASKRSVGKSFMLHSMTIRRLAAALNGAVQLFPAAYSPDAILSDSAKRHAW